MEENHSHTAKKVEITMLDGSIRRSDLFCAAIVKNAIPAMQTEDGVAYAAGEDLQVDVIIRLICDKATTASLIMALMSLINDLLLKDPSLLPLLSKGNLYKKDVFEIDKKYEGPHE